MQSGSARKTGLASEASSKYFGNSKLELLRTFVVFSKGWSGCFILLIFKIIRSFNNKARHTLISNSSMSDVFWKSLNFI